MSEERQEWESAAPAQTGGCAAQPGRQTDRQLQQEGKLPFQLQGAYVSPTLGLSGSPVSKLCPGRSNKTPRLLRHGHSSCLGRPFPSKETPEINGKRFIRGWVVSSLPPPAAPLLASLSSCLSRLPALRNNPGSSRRQVGTSSLGARRGEQGTTDPTVHSFISWLPHSFRLLVLVSFT